MNLSELKNKEIRATVQLDDETIIIKNPIGDVKSELLMFFQSQVNNTMDNAAKKRGRKKKVAENTEIFTLLLNKLTNITIDVEDVKEVLAEPSYELSVVMLYLSSIMQELIFEVMATQNLKLRMDQNTLLEKDTLKRISELDNLIKEMKSREVIENGKEVQ